jgi:hypothetical protein
MKGLILLVLCVGFTVLALPSDDVSGDSESIDMLMRPGEGFEENDAGWCTVNPGNEC